MPRPRGLIPRESLIKIKCFICDTGILEKGVPLLLGQTPYSKTGLPTKIGQLMGDRFMVVVSCDDMLCKRCSVLVNHLDKLETDLAMVKKALTTHLKIKYKLLDDEDPKNDEFINEEIKDIGEKNDEVISNHSADYSHSEDEIENLKPKIYTCLICNFKTHNSSDYNNHQKDCVTLSCQFCKAIYNKESEYNNHIQMHMVIKHKNEEEKHILQNQENNFQTRTKSPLVQEKLESSREVVKCDICYKTFENRKAMVEHSKHHKNILYKCGICFVTFKEKLILIEHMKIHKKLESKETVERNINENINTTTLNKTPNEIIADPNNIIFHNCNLCSITFLNQSLFNEHMKIHEISNSNFESNLETSLTSLDEISPRKDFIEIDRNEIDNNLEQMFERIHSEGVHLPVDEQLNKETLTQLAEGRIQPLETMPPLDTLLQNHPEESQTFIKIQLLNQNPINQVPLDTETNTENINFSNEISLNPLEASAVDNQFININNTELNDPNLKEILELLKEKKIAVSLDEPLIDSLENFCNVQVKSELEQTSVTSLPVPMFTCASCGFRDADIVQLKTHFAEQHSEESSNFLCQLCNISFQMKSLLDEHLLSHKEALINNGTINKKLFETKTELYSEIDNNDKSVIFCQECGLTFPTKKALKIHQDTENHHVKEFKCKDCDKIFPKERQLTNHHNKYHRDLHCKHCGKEFRQIKALKSHEHRHEKVSDMYECPTCKRVFKTKTGLRHHLAVHTGEYKYCCNFCGRGFMSRMMMEEHLSKHTKEERYICDVCGRKFSFQSTYWIHRKWHDNPYPYKCNFCNRMFRHSSLLAVHKRKHTGERPYKCPHCSLTFSVGGTLKRHLILHTGIYPFNCTICKRGFTTKHKYAQHMAKLHEDFSLLNEKPQQIEYKMAVRDNNYKIKPENNEHQSIIWELGEDFEVDPTTNIHFKVEDLEDKNISSTENAMIPCTIITDAEMGDDDLAGRVVEIVLDESSQAVATVNLEHNSLIPELWYQSGM